MRCSLGTEAWRQSISSDFGGTARERTGLRLCADRSTLLFSCVIGWAASGIACAQAPQQGLESGQPSIFNSPQLLAQAGKPATRDSLFADDPPADKPKSKPASKPGSRDSLFADDPPADQPKADPGGKPPTRDSLFGDDAPAADKQQPGWYGWRGFIQGEAARSYRDPEH